MMVRWSGEHRTSGESQSELDSVGRETCFHFTSICIFQEFSVGALENVLIDMQGMGFLNTMMNKVVLTMVNQNIHTVLMASGKEFMRKEFEDFSLIDQMYSGFKIL